MGVKQKKFLSKSKDKSSSKSGLGISATALLELLTAGHKPMRIDQILRAGGFVRKQKKLVEEVLFQLIEQGRVMRLHGGQWVAKSQIRTLVGKYSIQRSGAHFVDIINDKSQNNKSSTKPSSVFIHPSQAGAAWHGDIVRVALLPGRRTRSEHSKPEGRIVEVLERVTKELSVRVLHQEKGHKQARFLLCKPSDPRFPFTLRIDAQDLDTLPKRGELILVKPVEQLASDLWTAQLIATIGFEEDISVQENLVKLNHNAPADFPTAALNEAMSFAKSPTQHDLEGREDFSHLPFVTIDGETARDFDDAIHVQKLSQSNDGFNGWCLRVGIADVTHYLRPNSALDREAQVRGNSWYFPRSVEPMLPAVLSNGLCSLNPHETRLIMLAELYITLDGKVQKSRFAHAHICSAARLTYNQVKSLVLDKDMSSRTALTKDINGEKILYMLEEALQLARVLALVREQRGSLEFHMPEPEYIFDENGRVVDIKRKENHFAHQIIEEFMIATNEAVARFLTEQDIPLLYRIHPEPESTHLEGLFRTLATTSLEKTLPKQPSATSLQTILHAAKASPQEFLISRLTLRTMPQARYYPENIGHFGLASTNYCHFTSPIRRYADVVVHRALKYALGLDNVAIPTNQKLVILGDKINHTERAAIDAEREMAKRLAVLVLQDRIGEGFDGIICGLSDFGVFVEFEAMPIEGMIRIKDLGDDFFEYDQERQELIGVMHGKIYKLGQSVRTRLLDVNLGRLEITLGLIQNRKSKESRPQYLIKKNKRRFHKL